jgi:AcrR family transcriptional regulator
MMFVERTVLYTPAMAPSSPSRKRGSSVSPQPTAGTSLPAPPRLPRRREPPSRRTALTIEGIVAAAIEVLDEGGVGGLSMRRVAEQIGTGPASLYAHVSGKDQLLELVFDELVRQVPLPEPDPRTWREQIHQMMGDLRAVLVSHRDAALAGLGRIPTSPNVLTAAETLTAVMQAGGLSNRVVALGLDQLTLYVSAAAFEEGLMEHSGMSPEEIQSYYAQVHQFYEQLPAQRFPVLAAIAPDLTGPDGDERFRFGLDVLIAGLEALSAAETPPSAPGRKRR